MHDEWIAPHGWGLLHTDASPRAPLNWALLRDGKRPVQGDESDLRPIAEAPWNGADKSSSQESRWHVQLTLGQR